MKVTACLRLPELSSRVVRNLVSRQIVSRAIESRACWLSTQREAMLFSETTPQNDIREAGCSETMERRQALGSAA